MPYIWVCLQSLCYNIQMAHFREKTGYTRKEFGIIFQVYSRAVYKNIFKDFSFTELNNQFFISFREEAGKKPLITIEKRKLGPKASLFIATQAGSRGAVLTVARSEKIESFAEQLENVILSIEASKKGAKLSSDKK